MNWSTCHFPRSYKSDRSSTWRSDDSSGSVVAVACTGKINCRTGPLDVLRTSVRATCSPFPPNVRQGVGDSDRKRSIICAADTVSMNTPANTSVCIHGCVYMHSWMHVDVSVNVSACVAGICGRVHERDKRGRVSECMQTCPWMHLQAFTQHPLLDVNTT